MSDFEVRVSITGAKDVADALKRMDAAARADALKTAALAGAQVIRNAASGGAPRRTGNLRRSIHVGGNAGLTPGFDGGTPETGTYSDIGGQTVADTKVELLIGTNLVYAAIHEFGGTIVPKNAQFLTIPLTATAEKYTARSYPGKLHAIINGDSGVLADAAGEAVYALTRHSTIPAHPYLRPALDSKAQAAADQTGVALKQLLAAKGIPV